METISPESVEVKLENKDLWDKFNTLGTEMVITKTGRRMFPSLEVSIQGLLPDETYMVILDITKVDDRRYKYNEKDNHWKFVETRILSPSPVGMFVHALCPCSGNEICVQPLSFNKVKLTNNPHTVSFGHILLDSMCRYVPRLSIVTYRDYHNQRWENGVAFMFKETEFIAVTAYMNKEITKLKIDNNPFARAFRENGLKGKGLQNNTTLSDAISIDFGKDQTAEESKESEALTSITYLKDEESNDSIQVLHVSPSSIIVTDVLPSFPSTSSLMDTTNLPSPKMLTTEVNVVFETTGNSAKANEKIVSQTPSSYEAEKNGLNSLLYPVLLEKSGFITREKSGGKVGSSHEEIIEVDDEADFLCKVSDVRSIRETPPSDDQVNRTRMRSSLECEENMECLYKEKDRADSRDKCERIEAETTTKCLKYEENGLAEKRKLANEETKCCDKYDTFDGEHENHLVAMRNGGCWNNESSSENPLELTRKTIEIQDICKDTNVSPKKEKLVNDDTGKLTHLNGVISTCDERRITRDKVECDNLGEEVEERKLQDSGDSWSEKMQDQQRRVQIVNSTNEDNNSQGNVDSDCVKESPSNEEFPTKETLKPQISKLLNFVNSVSMPGVLKFGTEKKTLTLHQDSNTNSLEESPEILLGQKRSVGGKPAVEPKKARLMEHSNGLKSCDHSSNVLSSVDQSKDSLEILNQSEKRFKSVDQSEGMVKSLSRPQEATIPTNSPNNSAHCQTQKLKSSISNLTPLQVNIKKEFCNESSRFVQEQSTNNETLKEKNETEENTSKGIPTTVINVGHEERKKSLVSNGLHRRDSLYRTKYPEQCQGKARGSGIQGLNQMNSTRNKQPSCLEEGNGMRQVVGNQNGVLVESASRKSFPVILSSYSIPPSKFSNQQSIDLNNETRVDDRVPVVYPAENFYVKENQGKEVLEKCPTNKTETSCQPKLREGKKEVCTYPAKSNVNYRKIFPKPVPHEGHYNLIKQKEFIDLSSSMSANLYQRQSENLDHNYLANKGVPLQVLYTFETKMSLSRAPDPRLPEVYNPTRTTFTGYASKLICSTLPISTANKGFQPAPPGKYY